MVDLQTSFPSSGSPSSGFRITPQLIVGLLIIFVGVVFTLDELGIAPAVSYLRYWPLALIAIGVLKMLQARDGGGAFAGLLFAIVGVWLQAEELDIIHIRIWEVWPLALVIFGGYLVWQGLAGRDAPREAHPAATTFPERDQASPPSSQPASQWASETSQRVADANSTLSAMAILGGVSRGNNSRSFRGADLLAIMGGLQIDLRQAAIHGEAVMDVFVMWGGVEIRVPEDWTVSSRIVPLMAGVEDKTRPPQGASTHRLVLRGFALMGGVEIKN
jgi:predicted membrane protein